MNADGLDYTLTQADGKYTLDSQVSNGGNNHFLNGEWNDGAAMGWIFAAVEGKEGVYTISNGEKFLTAQENGEVTLADDATAEAAQWTLKTLEARIAELATATAEAPVNATFLIQDANFCRIRAHGLWKPLTRIFLVVTTPTTTQSHTILYLH